MRRLYQRLEASSFSEVNFLALVLLCLVLCFSTGFLPQYLEYTDIESWELCEKNEKKGETDNSENKEKVDKETDDYTEFHYSHSIRFQSTKPHLTIGKYDWHTMYLDIFDPPPELG